MQSIRNLQNLHGEIARKMPFYRKKFVNYPIKKIVRYFDLNSFDGEKICDTLNIIYNLRRVSFPEMNSVIDNSLVDYAYKISRLFKYILIYENGTLLGKTYVLIKDMSEAALFITRNPTLKVSIVRNLVTFEEELRLFDISKRVLVKVAKMVMEKYTIKHIVSVQYNTTANTSTLIYKSNYGDYFACLEVSSKGIRHYEKESGIDLGCINLISAISYIKEKQIWRF